MTATFSLLCQFCGLSQREAADFLGVRIDTVKSWGAGRNPVPPRVLAELAALAERIDAAADEAVDLFTKAKIDEIELGVASDDHEAQSLGWPCIGAHRALCAQVVARGMAEGYRFKIVARGSTVATAGAADANER